MNIDKSALPTIMAVLKLLEQHAERSIRKGDFSRNIKGSKNPNELIKQVLSELDNTSIDTLKKILVSMALMTNGNVETLRDPRKFKRKHAEPLKSAMSLFVEEVFMVAGGDINRLVTKEDYLLAKNILPIVSAVKMDRQKLVGLLKGEYEVPGRGNISTDKDLVVADVLYRGLHSMSYKTIIFLLFNPKPSWDISRAVSTSENKNTSLTFTKKGSTGWGILFHIANKDGHGFHVGDMSWFKNESEYLLAGKLQVKGVNIKLRCYREVEKGPLWDTWIIKSRGGETTINIGRDTLTGKDASNLILKIMFADGESLKSFEHNEYEWFYKGGENMAEVFSAVDPEKPKKPLEEMSLVGGGVVQGAGAPLEDNRTDDAFNEVNGQESGLEDPQLTEMYSTQGLSGRNNMPQVSAEKEYAGHLERSISQRLKNFKQPELETSSEQDDPNCTIKTENKKYKIIISQNPLKSGII